LKKKILLKEQIKKFYEKLRENYNFYGPIEENGNIVFSKILDPEDIILNYYNSKIPPKSVILPQKEILFEYEKKGDEIEIEEPENIEEKNIIFGIRPCDAHSFYLLKNFFEYGEYEDTLFTRKRKNTTLIGIGCNTPRQTCFCTSLGGHPFKKEDMDIFLVDLGEKYLVKSISKKGEEILNQISWLSDATKSDIQKAEKLSKTAEELISTEIDIEKAISILKNNFNHPIWKEISENCIGCGSCAFLCPTCHCFDVIDEEDHYNNRGKRIRIWDTCQFTLYTLETSGHNPRPSKIERCRNRILHKFSYYPSNYDLIGCVGCGRCINWCPANNDLRIILKKINKIDKKEESIVA